MSKEKILQECLKEVIVKIPSKQLLFKTRLVIDEPFSLIELYLEIDKVDLELLEEITSVFESKKINVQYTIPDFINQIPISKVPLQEQKITIHLEM